MNLPYIIKVAISEQRIVDAIGKRVDRIAALPADQQGDLALKTYGQMLAMNGKPSKFVERTLGKRDGRGIYSRVRPETYEALYPKAFIDNSVHPIISNPGIKRQAEREIEIAQLLLDKKFDEAGKKKTLLDRDMFRVNDSGWGDWYRKNDAEYRDMWAENLEGNKRSLKYYKELDGATGIDQNAAKKFKKSIGATDAAEAAAPQAMKFMKRYRVPLAIGAGLGLAGLGAGIYANNKNKNKE